ncbi:TonB-dependent receptor [Alteromonas halophila]|uniref:TonB-dependent receptor n=1 Tax=Alteromonas halophila TaxID=516698 RepID=A0A918JLX2_9ALTE|nr:TonB-dependent receptor [Alteromonas halophila]GGW82748.1 TonB-dependent receptor [Alteromonas halophila]
MTHKLSKITLGLLSATTIGFSTYTLAQETESAEASEPDVEVIEVSGIRSSLTGALSEKRSSDNLVEVIKAVDIGKLPDQNLAEVLENVTGIQITREAGVGTGVQIRGTNANRTEINGVSTVSSGAGRGGIDFEDVSAAIISAVEVIKAPEAKTVEGSVGATINLRTIRPLQLSQTLGSLQVQGEDSSLSTDGIQPRVSGAFGDVWFTDIGEVGVVFSGSYSEQDVTAFRPRADRDNLIASDSGAASAQSFDFLPIQFLNQDYDNFEYETMNIAGSLEWAPNDNTRLFFDVVINDQERRQESSRVQASGVSALNNIAVPDEFEDVDFGSLGGTDLGSIQAALSGVIPVDLNDDDDDPNLRFSSDTNSRITKSEVFRLGGDWQGDNMSVFAEVSRSTSDSTTPSFNTTLNFINPNAPVDAGGGNDNSVPLIYDLSGGSLSYGVAFGEAFAPTQADLLNPNNVVLRDVNIGQDVAENQEDAFRVDISYDVDWGPMTVVDFGYRYSKTTSLRDQIRTNVGLRSMDDSPRGSLFADILTAGPDNFNDADGRALYVRDFLLINPELAASDPQGVLSTLNGAITEHGGSRAIDDPSSSVSGFFDIEEQTDALYAQANFEWGMFRGNAGFRYVDTEVTSVGNSTTEDANGNEIVERVVSKGDYDFFLPRLNIVAEVAEDVIVRSGWSKDIRRPNFSDLSTSVTFSTSPNPPVAIGNPGLEPEEVTSFDLSVEWYFAPASLLSAGIFHKKRDNLFVAQETSPYEDPQTGFRDTTAPCEQGGIFNPIADVNVFGPSGGVGVCVPTQTVINDSAETTQKGLELAFQYDLSVFEESLGWASGFGIIANYTKQEFSGGEATNTATSRAANVFAATTGNSDIEVEAVQGLLDLSENAYNFTLYYEKYGLSARARYTWREAYRSEDFGSTSSYPWGFPVVQDDRGQLNASISYDVNENLSVGVEGVNITKSDVNQYCVNEGALLCFQGLTDRRITFGVTYQY